MLKAALKRKKRMRELSQKIAELRNDGSLSGKEELMQLEAEHDKLKAKGKKLIKHDAI